MSSERFAVGEFYHIYNRGVEGRNIFSDARDKDRFLKSMVEFNTKDPVGSLWLLSLQKSAPKKTPRSELVDIVCYCLNPNHFHFILREKIEGGISEFMKRMGGYTKYFNAKYKRSGVLFQGVCQSRHIDSNEYLLYASAYVNLNWRVHQLRRETSQLGWDEYMSGAKDGICKKDIILKQFKNTREYRKFAEETLETILEKKQLSKELKSLLIE